nr:hypothetical protein Iba_chr03aCG5910 [Ipomoea batatas]
MSMALVTKDSAKQHILHAYASVQSCKAVSCRRLSEVYLHPKQVILEHSPRNLPELPNEEACILNTHIHQLKHTQELRCLVKDEHILPFCVGLLNAGRLHHFHPSC